MLTPQSGNKVKVFCKIGLQKKESWQLFTFLGRGPQNTGFCRYGSEQSGQIHNFPLDKIYELIQMPTEALDEFGRANIEELEKLIRSACQRLLREDQQPESITVDSTDSIINVLPELTVQPSIIEVKSIGAIAEVAGWSVLRWVRSTGNYDNPPDVDEVPVGEARNNIDTALIVANELFAISMNGFRDTYCDQKMAEEFKDEPGN